MLSTPVLLSPTGAPARLRLHTEQCRLHADGEQGVTLPQTVVLTQQQLRTDPAARRRCGARSWRHVQRLTDGRGQPRAHALLSGLCYGSVGGGEGVKGYDASVDVCVDILFYLFYLVCVVLRRLNLLKRVFVVFIFVKSQAVTYTKAQYHVNSQPKCQ